MGIVQKLLKLRAWLTLDEAVQYLSTVLGEPVAEADLLRLGLDGHLTLSVDFVNHAEAYLGRVVPYKDVPHHEMPAMLRDGSEGTELLRYPDGLLLDKVEKLSEDTRFVCFDQTRKSISGIWDLSMMGAERLDVEHRFQRLTGGPAVELVHLEGPLVTRSDNEWAQILVPFRDVVVDPPDIKEKVGDIYHPAGGLPSDAVLVVRLDALMRFQAMLLNEQGERAGQEINLSTRERGTLLKLVVGMALEAYRYDPAAMRSPTPDEITQDLAKHGISIDEDTVRKYLKEAVATVLPKRAKP